MPQEEKKPVQVSITVAGNEADETAVQAVVTAVMKTLREPEIVDSIDATIVTKIKTSGT